MLAFEKSKYLTSFCDFSQAGNEGPRWQELIKRAWTWNGGTQLELTFTVKELENRFKFFSLLSFRKCVSVTVPVK